MFPGSVVIGAQTNTNQPSPTVSVEQNEEPLVPSIVLSCVLHRCILYTVLAGLPSPASPGIVASFRGRYDISYNVDLIMFSLCPFPDEYAHVCQIWCQLVHPFGSYSRFLIF